MELEVHIGVRCLPFWTNVWNGGHLFVFVQIFVATCYKSKPKYKACILSILISFRLLLHCLSLISDDFQQYSEVFLQVFPRKLLFSGFPLVVGKWRDRSIPHLLRRWKTLQEKQNMRKRHMPRGIMPWYDCGFIPRIYQYWGQNYAKKCNFKPFLKKNQVLDWNN